MALVPLLLGASIAAASLPPSVPATAAAPRHPALWVVNDDDTIIYLFGTFHALDGRSNWFGQAVKTAFFASDELMLETLVPKPGAPLPTTFNQQASPQGPGPGGPVAQLAPSASYLATTKVVMNAGRSQGLSTDNGADAVLREVADETGKPVGGLESFQYQLRMFSSLPSGGAQPPQDSKAVAELADMLSHLEAAWSRGDIENTFSPLLRQMQAQSPQTYKIMFEQRNARWAQWIANRLKAPGTVFVAVGAGHLSGPDSVQKQLASIGVKSARIN